MAFETFIPKEQPLDASVAFFEAYTWRGLFPIKKTVNGVETPVNMQEYDLTAPVIVFKNAAGGSATGCPVGTCSWTNSAGGEFQVDITQANTNPASQVFQGVYEIYVQHDTEEDSTGVKKRAMVYKGPWTIVPTVAAT